MRILANGCFDGLHPGHIDHLEQAVEGFDGLRDQLIVAVTIDEAVNKGPGRPIFNQHARRHLLESLRIVDFVIFVSSAMEALRVVRPHIFVKGPDYNIDTIEPEHRAFCEKYGISIRFTEGPKYSSRAVFK